MVQKYNMSIPYPEKISLSDALRIFREQFSCTARTITIPVQESLGKITAEPIFSPLSVPAAHISAMDGIAVKSADTIKAKRDNPIILTDSVRVNTGNVVPDRYDAVIMIEDVEECDNGYLIRSPVRPRQHIRLVGTDILLNELILPRLTNIRLSDIGALISYGISEVPVRDLKIALIPTGNEVVPIGTHPEPGQVIESNMHVAASLLKSAGITVTHFPIIADEKQKLKKSVQRAVKDHDIILISAGSSKGTKDYTASVIADLGTVFVHGIAIIPAKTTIIGEIQGKPVIGMPGYPVANYTVLREIVVPLLLQYGFDFPESEEIPVHLAEKVQSSMGFDEFIFATVGKIRGKWVALPFPRGACVQMHAVRSNAYLQVPAEIDELSTGAQTAAYLTVPKRHAEQVILVTGSHDPSIDYLEDMVRSSGIRIASSHVGSMGGLYALQNAMCHLAPMHLLAADGEYNIPYLKKHFPHQELVLIGIGDRVQGIVSRDILGIADITSHRFINRQKGSGTRMFLDHQLKKHGIPKKKIDGYNREVNTHLEVCLAVKNNEADLGMTIFGAARACSLPFIPVGVERYELVTTKQLFKEDHRIRLIVETIQSQQFREVLIHLGGYETENTGTIRFYKPK